MNQPKVHLKIDAPKTRWAGSLSVCLRYFEDCVADTIDHAFQVTSDFVNAA